MDALADDLWNAYTRFVYSIELSLEWIDSPLFSDDEINLGLVGEMYSYLSSDQRSELSDHLEGFGKALERVAREAMAGKRNSEPTVVKSSQDKEVSSAFFLITRNFASTITHPKRSNHAHSAAIVSIYSSFEIFAGELLETLYCQRPAMISGNPSISLRDVSDLSDGQSILKRIAGRQVEAELQEPITTWIERLARHGGISLPRKRWDWPHPWNHICAISAIRNCVVHSGGKIDKKLMARMSDIGQESTLGAEGSLISLTESDIHESLESCLEAASQLYFKLLVNQISGTNSKVDRQDYEPKMLHRICDLQWDLMSRGHHRIARIIGTCRPRADLALVRKIDAAAWTAVVLEGVGAIDEDLESKNWDHGPVATIHKYALLDDRMKLFDAVVEAVESGSLPKVVFLFAPEFILARQRLDDKYEELRQGWKTRP